ncbi:membrane-associated protein, putative [Bodo saltans]|uniref:Membrane-associated protein, putative n=1 Tax=Bodo saltans TaxID=75058 RepID=A0A0S4KJN9_BODSA|nr:membrane-associated protein, putative [Bodo saltans]|eukprot:CUI11266.1 membrane-associated protein, putative [Bodo saltans]
MSAGNSAVDGLATMNWEAWVTVFTCATVLVSLSLGIVDCAPAMVVSAVFLYLCQIVEFSDVLGGLSNSSVVTIALLFIIVDPIADLPKVRSGVARVLGDLSSNVGLRWATFKIVVMCMGTSSFLNNAPQVAVLTKKMMVLFFFCFLNNTPQVAVLTNIIKWYCRDCGAYPSQILLPMNFATLCGNYALIGTSTNLIVDGLMQKYGMGRMPFFELLKINGPFTVVMVLYLVFLPYYLLPRDAGGMFRSIKDNTGVYLSRLRVRESSVVIGVRIASLLDAYRESVMEGLEVLQLVREEITIFPITGEETLQAGRRCAM